MNGVLAGTALMIVVSILIYKNKPKEMYHDDLRIKGVTETPVPPLAVILASGIVGYALFSSSWR